MLITTRRYSQHFTAAWIRFANPFISISKMVYLVGTLLDTDIKTKKKLIKSSTNTALILWTEVR